MQAPVAIQFAKQIKKGLTRWLARQLVNDLSAMLPPMMTSDIAANLGLTSVFGPPIKKHSLGDTKTFIRKFNITQPKEATSLDLGCGEFPQNPFAVNEDKVYGIDLRDDLDKKIKSADLAIEKIPFPDNSFTFVTAHDFIEHIPRISLGLGSTRFPFVEIMNEIYRVLKPEGYFLSRTPAYPSLQAFQDPTHVNYITLDTFPLYFCRQNDVSAPPAAKMYGFRGEFEMIGQETAGWLFTLLRKI